MTDDPFPSLDTKRVHLRCIETDDAAAMSLLITPQVSRWVASWPVPYTPSMAIVRIEAVRKLAFRRDSMPLAVVNKASGKVMGLITVSRDAKNPHKGSFGYWLGEPYQGKGYMKESAPIVLAAAFEWLDLDVIEAAAQPGNTGSFKVMEACGMRFVREDMVHAPARKRDEMCRFYEIVRAEGGKRSGKNERMN